MNRPVLEPPLRNGLWNLLYRSVSATDQSRTAWTGILRGSAQAFFKETIDDLPLGNNDAARSGLKERFFALPGHRVYDLFEFLLADDRAGLKETDRKLIRRGLNPLLEAENAPVRLLRDRFVPLQDEVGVDALASAEEGLTLFDMPAARRHLDSAVAFLARRPEPAAAESVREAILAVAAAVAAIGREAAPGPGGGAATVGRTEVALGTAAPVAAVLGIPPALREAIDAVLGRAGRLSGLPGGASPVSPSPPGAGSQPPAELPDAAEAVFLVTCCAAILRYLLSRLEAARPSERPPADR